MRGEVMKDFNQRSRVICQRFHEWELENILVKVVQLDEQNKRVYMGEMIEFYTIPKDKSSVSYKGMSFKHRKLNLGISVHDAAPTTEYIGFIDDDGCFYYCAAPSLYESLGWWFTTKPEFFSVLVDLESAINTLMCNSEMFGQGGKRKLKKYFLPEWEKLLYQYRHDVSSDFLHNEIVIKEIWLMCLQEAKRLRELANRPSNVVSLFP